MINSNMPIYYEHVTGAIRAIESGSTDGAVRILKMIVPSLALDTIRVLDQDTVGSQMFHELLEVVTKYHQEQGNGE